jgi:hypothetical protein
LTCKEYNVDCGITVCKWHFSKGLGIIVISKLLLTYADVAANTSIILALVISARARANAPEARMTEANLMRVLSMKYRAVTEHTGNSEARTVVMTRTAAARTVFS